VAVPEEGLEKEYHLRFTEFGKQYAHLPKEQFLAAFTAPFLVIDFEGMVDVPDKLKGTAGPPPLNALTQFTPGHDEKMDKVVVAPLVKSDRNKVPNSVTLGRAATNDIVLPHGVVSKVHAVFKKDLSTGVYTVTDAKSRYGTAVNGKPLMPAEPFPLASKANIVFARFVQAIFFSPVDFFQHMHLMLHLGREK
jgi:hypothetical protein